MPTKTEQLFAVIEHHPDAEHFNRHRGVVFLRGTNFVYDLVADANEARLRALVEWCYPGIEYRVKTLHRCECENIAHDPGSTYVTGRRIRTPQGNYPHDYGAPAEKLVRVHTVWGDLHVCQACADDCCTVITQEVGGVRYGHG